MGPKSDSFLDFHRVESLIPSPRLHLFLVFSEQSIINVSRVWFWLFFLASFTANFNLNFWVAWNSYRASSLGFLGPNTTASTHSDEFAIWWPALSSPDFRMSVCFQLLTSRQQHLLLIFTNPQLIHRFCLLSLKNYIHVNINSPYFSAWNDCLFLLMSPPTHLCERFAENFR